MPHQQDKINVHILSEMALVKVLRAMSSFCAIAQHQIEGFTPVVVSDFTGSKENLVLCDQETMSELVTIEISPTITGELKAFFFGNEEFNGVQPVFSADIFSPAAFPANAHEDQGDVAGFETNYTLKNFSQRALDFATLVWKNKNTNDS